MPVPAGGGGGKRKRGMEGCVLCRKGDYTQPKTVPIHPLHQQHTRSYYPSLARTCLSGLCSVCYANHTTPLHTYRIGCIELVPISVIFLIHSVLVFSLYQVRT